MLIILTTISLELYIVTCGHNPLSKTLIYFFMMEDFYIMAKEYRKNFRFDEHIRAFLDTKDNSTEYITKLIIKDMSQQTSLLVEIQKLQEEEKKLKIQLKDNELQQQNLQQQLELTKEQAQYRVDAYDECVDVLKSIKQTSNHVTLSDIRIQANRCGVDLSLFKQWLFDDGVYDLLLK